MSKKLEDLHPLVQEQAKKLKELAEKELGLHIVFTQTLRTESEQRALFAQGRMSLDTTNALRKVVGWGPITEKENSRKVTNAQSVADSYHGYGLAFDIAVTDPTGKQINWNNSDWNDNEKSDWEEVGKLAEKVGLEWGGNWTKFKDIPHFQNSFGYSIAQLKAGSVTLP